MIDPIRRFIEMQGDRIGNIIEAGILRVGLVSSLPDAGEGNRGGLLRVEGTPDSLWFSRNEDEWVEIVNTTDGYTHDHDSTYVNVAGDTMTGALIHAAGTASASSWSKLQSGTLLTAAEAGAIEYSGGAFYFTPDASNRALIPASHIIWQDANYTGSNSNTAQKIFNESTNGSITLPNSASYHMHGAIHIHTTGTTSHDFRLKFNSGTANFDIFSYSVFVTLVGTEVASTPSLSWISTSSEAVMTTAAASETHHTVLIDGIIKTSVGGGGTFIPEYRWSAAPGVAGVTLEGSHLVLTRLGGTAVGNWS